MAGTIINGKQIAQRMRERVRQDAAAFQAKTQVVPHLVAVLVGDDPASAVYVRNKERACREAGIAGTVHRLSAETTQEELLELIDRLNHDPAVHGILVQMPLPKGLDAVAVLDAIDPLKDVDAFGPENVGRIVQGRPRFLPCTPAGIVELLRATSISTTGKHAVVLGRSEIVGKPMALLLLQKGALADATVTVCHSRTPDIGALTRQADLLIAAIGKPRFVTADMVKPGAVVIDVGINRVAEGLVGDVDFGPVSQIASAITPVPGGVGPMTIAVLLRNTLTAAELLTEARTSPHNAG